MQRENLKIYIIQNAIKDYFKYIRKGKMEGKDSRLRFGMIVKRHYLKLIKKKRKKFMKKNQYLILNKTKIIFPYNKKVFNQWKKNCL